MNRKGKTVDTTSLYFLKSTGGNDLGRRMMIHRDYLAHCLRWSHVVRYLQRGKRHQTAHVLDVGCGREALLPRLLSSMRLGHTTGSYTGVDYGPIDWPDLINPRSKKFRMKLLPNIDFAIDSLPRKRYDVVTSFEVLEHVEPMHAFRMLQRVHEVIGARGVAFLSTPCYDLRVGAAGNHVNEMSYDGFHALLQLAGLRMKGVWGTFASQRDYRQTLSECYPGIDEAVDALREYYDSAVLACLLAPLVPEHARNCLWRVSRTTPTVLQPKILKQLATPRHGSSAEWPKTLKRLNQEVARVQR